MKRALASRRAYLGLHQAGARLPWTLMLAIVVAGATVVVLSGCEDGSKRHPGSSSPPASTDASAPSPDPYRASLAYAQCMRQHGVPHPDPDKEGDFQLTQADERRMRRVGRDRRESAEKACFKHLKGLNLNPLSAQAIARANKVVGELGACLESKGFKVGAPTTKNLIRGRASFGFKWMKGPIGVPQAEHGRYTHACERRVNLGKRLTKIINEERRVDDL